MRPFSQPRESVVFWSLGGLPATVQLVVNFGKLLERWTGGRIRATPHRVLGNDVPRYSIPFFYEPRVDARIAPLDFDGAARFEPFTYGDHLWESMSEFVEFQDAERFERGGSRS
jgi:isopenicillin N synthase-like dioxygenase